MKITKEQLKEMIRESIHEEGIYGEDFFPGKYHSERDIVGRYSDIILRKLGLSGDHKARITVINALSTAVDDAMEFSGEQR